MCYLDSMNVAEMGKALKAARKAKGLTMKEAAAACGRSYQWIDNLEAGRREASFEDLSKLADVVGMRLIVDLVPTTGEQAVAVGPGLAAIIENMGRLSDKRLAHLQRILAALQKAPLEAVSSATYLLEMAAGGTLVAGGDEPAGEGPATHRLTA